MKNKALAAFGIGTYIFSVISSATDLKGNSIVPTFLVLISGITTTTFIILATIRLWKPARKISIILASSTAILFLFELAQYISLPKYGSPIIVLANITRVIYLVVFVWAIVLLFKINNSPKSNFGFARVLAKARVQQQLNKRFFGKPYLKLGQCMVLWGYCFQFAGVLGAKNNSRIGEFGTAYLGFNGDPAATKDFFSKVLKDKEVTNKVSFFDFVQKDFIKRNEIESDIGSFFIEHAMSKIDIVTAQEFAYEYSILGAAFGALYPEKFQEMFKYNYKPVPKEEWEEAYSAGLNISPEQAQVSYEEVEEEANKVFKEYCLDYCPELCPSLTM